VSDQERYADKIAKLLAKAESTTPEEAELLIAKAQELMTEYAISEAMIDAARGVERDEIVQEELVYFGTFYKVIPYLGWAAMSANNCRGFYRDWQRREPEPGKKPQRCYVITCVGFKSDVDRVRALDASLRLQCAAAMNEWWQGSPHAANNEWYSNSDRYKIRRSFIDGFAGAVRAKLETAREAGEKAAVEAEAVRSSTTVEDATASVALVLRSRKDRVDDWMDKTYGKLGKSRSRSYSVDYSGHSAGRSAGARADVGQPGMRSRRGLNR
jgi:hypothetical protein